MKKLWNRLLVWLGIRKGFYSLEYKGIPIILRDDIPEDILLLHQKDGTWKAVNIKTQDIFDLKYGKIK